jgi:hypothetical protein
MVQVHTVVNADGKTLANIVATHQAKQMSRPNRGVSGFDIMSAPMRPATAR